MSLTLAQKLDYIPALVCVATTFAWALLTLFWRAPEYPQSWMLHIGYAVFRRLTGRFSIAQMQYVLPPSNKVYERYMRSTGETPRTVQLNHGAMGHWIGDPHAQHILIWYHGGGFALPANIGYFKFFRSVVVAQCTGNKHSLAIFALTYTLAPVATYPTQLRQAVEALRHVLVDQGRRPSRVLLGGDSAGGNLVGGVLSHLAHTHPAIEPLAVSTPLAGAVLIAPWTLLDPDPADRIVDARGDLLTAAVAGPWSRAYVGRAAPDYFTDLSTAPPDWFAPFPVRRILVCGGGSEILLPVIEDFVLKLRAGFPEEVEFWVGAGEGHVAPVYNLYLGETTETQQGGRVKQFIKRCCS
ncbi:hypothetical protein AOCH_007384 [Aspergillus ochraceoroseus]|nr:hypothetical protein AOCH_007384 [Aspergillus ochraceoroseus]